MDDDGGELEWSSIGCAWSPDLHLGTVTAKFEAVALQIVVATFLLATHSTHFFTPFCLWSVSLGGEKKEEAWAKVCLEERTLEACRQWAPRNVAQPIQAAL